MTPQTSANDKKCRSLWGTLSAVAPGFFQCRYLGYSFVNVPRWAHLRAALRENRDRNHGLETGTRSRASRSSCMVGVVFS